jgi:hypothetical protein
MRTATKDGGMARSGTALGDGLNGAGVAAADPAFSSPARQAVALLAH